MREGWQAGGLAPALAHFWFLRGYDVEGCARLERFLAVLAVDDDPALLRARALEGLTPLVYSQGEYARAVETFEQSLSGVTGAALNLLDYLAHDRGDLDAAESFFKASLSARREAIRVGEAYPLEGLAGVEVERGRADRVARLCGAAAAIREATGRPTQGYLTRRLAADREAIRASLDDRSFAAEWRAGRRIVSRRAAPTSPLKRM